MSSKSRRTRVLARSAMALTGGLALLVSSWVALSPASAASSPTLAPQASIAASPFSNSPVGYASLNGGTTGGFGGSTVEEYRLSQRAAQTGLSPGEALYQLLKGHQKKPASTGLVVYVDVKVTQNGVKESKIDVKDVSNVSILGVGRSGEFDGIGFKVTRSNNVVFRNLTIHHVSEGEGDALEITSNSSNVWIDHNDFSSELENAPNKDYYDGLVDIKHNSKYVTVSWNRFHDHWKTSLVGHNDSASSAPNYITYHHNEFRNLNSRVPLIRRADVHMLNNVFRDITGSAINARMGARVLVEGNHFENVGSGKVDKHAGYVEGPVGWFYGSSETGYWNLRNNQFVNSPHQHLSSTTNFTVPYSYQADSPAAARSAVNAYAGVGVINITP